MNFALGRIDMLQGKNAAAREKLIVALEVHPGHPEILESLLAVDANSGNLEDALTRIDKAAAEKPDDANLQRLAGIALLAAGQGPQAEAKLRRAIELDPNNLAAYQGLAQYLLGSNRQQEGVSTYEKAVEAQPGSAPLRFTLGTLYESTGRRDDAVAQYEEAIKLDPNLAVAKNNLAYLLADQGKDLDRALDLAQEAKSRMPDSPNVADTLGWVLLKKGIPEAAIGYLREAESSFPAGHPDAGFVRVHLAMAYEAADQPDSAREILDRALASLEEAQKAAAATGATLADPAWAGEARSLLARLPAAPAPAPQG